MEIPSFFMGKIIVTLFPFTDIPSGMKPSAAKSSVLTQHPGSALNSRKVPKMPCFCGFYGVGSNESVDEPSGFKRRGKIKLYQRRSYYALRNSPYRSVSALRRKLRRTGNFFVFRGEPASLGFAARRWGASAELPFGFSVRGSADIYSVSLLHVGANSISLATTFYASH